MSRAAAAIERRRSARGSCARRRTRRRRSDRRGRPAGSDSETTASRTAIAIATSTDRSSAAGARRRAGRAGSPRSRRRDELIASELKIARAFFFDRRSLDLLLVREWSPEHDLRARARPPGPSGFAAADAASRATSWLGARVAEIRGVRPLDADAPIPGLATLAAGDARRSRGGLPDSRALMPQSSRRGPMRRLTATRRRRGSLQGELDAGRLGLRRDAERGGALRGLEAGQLDDPGAAATTTSSDRDVDLARWRHRADPAVSRARRFAPTSCHISNVAPGPKRESGRTTALQRSRSAQQWARSCQASRTRYPTPGSATNSVGPCRSGRPRRASGAAGRRRRGGSALPRRTRAPRPRATGGPASGPGRAARASP